MKIILIGTPPPSYFVLFVIIPNIDLPQIQYQHIGRLGVLRNDHFEVIHHKAESKHFVDRYRKLQLHTPALHPHVLHIRNEK